jgi:hypothetical protein
MLDYLWLAEDGMKMQVCRRDSCFLSWQNYFACFLLSQGATLDTRQCQSVSPETIANAEGCRIVSTAVHNVE